MEIAEMVERIQNGESNLMHALWNEVEKFVAWISSKLAVLYVADGFASDAREAYMDIFSGGYPALYAAVNKYQPERGSFLSMLTYCIRTEARAFYGIRGTKRDAALYAESLNVPRNEDGGEWLDLIIDPNDPIEDADDELSRQELHALLEAATDELPDRESSIIRMRYFDGMTQAEIAEELGCTKSNVFNFERKAYRRIRFGSYGQQLYEMLYPGIEYSYGLTGVSLRNYRDTRERSTEKAALAIIALKEKTAKNLPVDQSILDVLSIIEKYESVHNDSIQNSN